MALSPKQIADIETILTDSLRNKFANHNPEPATMPFHTHLLGRDRLALYSFIHSLNTNFGVTIFEPVALSLASNNTQRFRSAQRQVSAGSFISHAAQIEIQDIIDHLTSAETVPDKICEIERIRKVTNQEDRKEVKLTNVDIRLESTDGARYLIDIKTAKPNRDGFKGLKRTLLEWSAVVLADAPEAEVHTLIAIPYNPYAPKPYSRWTMRGMLDLENELKVAEEFWDFLGGEGCYADLLGCFERVGTNLRDEIDDYFRRFSQPNDNGE